MKRIVTLLLALLMLASLLVGCNTTPTGPANSQTIGDRNESAGKGDASPRD